MDKQHLVPVVTVDFAIEPVDICADSAIPEYR